jgi:hypothetical protein
MAWLRTHKAALDMPIIDCCSCKHLLHIKNVEGSLGTRVYSTCCIIQSPFVLLCTPPSGWWALILLNDQVHLKLSLFPLFAPALRNQRYIHVHVLYLVNLLWQSHCLSDMSDFIVHSNVYHGRTLTPHNWHTSHESLIPFDFLYRLTSSQHVLSDYTLSSCLTNYSWLTVLGGAYVVVFT